MASSPDIDINGMVEERVRLSSLQARIPPSQITILPNGKQVLFLAPNYGKAMGGNLSLQLMNLYNNEDNEWGQAFDFASIANLSKELSLEQKLLRERTRTSAHGITSYKYHKQTNQVLFQYGPHLVISQLPDDEIKQYNSIPVVKIGDTSNDSMGTRMNPNLTNDGAWIVFARNNDLWITSSQPQQLSPSKNAPEIRLTFAQNIDKDITAGVSDFVHEEEFDRYTGYWLHPQYDDIDINNLMYRQYSILYLEADSRNVPVITIPSMQGIEQHKWPRAGENNCRSKVKIVTFAVPLSCVEDINNYQTNAVILKDYELAQSIYASFGWIEYIVRAGWSAREAECWVQYLDRNQMRCNVVLYTVKKHFVKASNDNYKQESDDDDNKEQQDIICGNELFCIQGTPYINIHDAYKWIKEGVLWVSEHTGFKHVYFISYPTKDESLSYKNDTHERTEADTVNMSFTIASSCNMQTITSGLWSVEGEALCFDDQSNTLYFRGRRETHLEKHLYCVQLQLSDDASTKYQAKKLTKSGFFHETNMDCIRFKYFSSVYSSTSSPRKFAIYSIDGECIKEFSVPHRGAPHKLKYVEPFIESIVNLPSNASDEQKVDKEFIDLHTFSAVIYPAFDDSYIESKEYKKGGYPTIIYVYGGPHVQLVTNSWDRVTGNSRCQLWRSLGFTVAMIDSRGSYNRGLAFEGRIKYKMGQIEIDDQVQLVKYLVERGLTNPKQVGIIGYSYGGYMSLMALCQRPDVFRVGIAGAPVTLWELYDTGYTERYMGTPQEHKEAYDNGAVTKYVQQFPDEEGRVAIIHGLGDENVHFYHTSKLINAMVKANKPYVLKIFPGERHGVRQWDNILYMEKFCIAHFQKMMINN